MEDVFVDESFRRKGYGTAVIKILIEEASKRCYKLIATSRYSREKVHDLYKKLGFDDYGLEFRMNFE
jgi:GNAT superfamily N-acetyltransferase